jgi:hypothetical protein
MNRGAQENVMTGRSKKAGRLSETLPLICLFASLALFVSFASPADDDLQQESAPCRRHQPVTLSKATHPVDVLARTTSCTATLVTGPRVRHVPAWVSATIEGVRLQDRIHIRQSGDLPPPFFSPADVFPNLQFQCLPTS